MLIKNRSTLVFNLTVASDKPEINKMTSYKNTNNNQQYNYRSVNLGITTKTTVAGLILLFCFCLFLADIMQRIFPIFYAIHISQ